MARLTESILNAKIDWKNLKHPELDLEYSGRVGYVPSLASTQHQDQKRDESANTHLNLKSKES